MKKLQPSIVWLKKVVNGGSQEMAAMMLMLIMHIAIININIIATISWPLSLISQLFH